MNETEILEAIEAMLRIQAANPPPSMKWLRASRILHELVKQLTGKHPQDACGR